VKSAIAVLAVFASLILASAAAAETVVPPGNSAATQYTEAFPTAGGNAKSNAGIGGGGGSGKPPSKVLGAGNAQKLESKGPVGEEVATLAAETAPVSATHSAHKHNGAHPNNAQSPGGKPAGGTGGGEGNNAVSGPRPAGSTAPDTSSGSSGLGEVLGQATGSSNGELGLFLPLILLGTVIWSIYYLRRERRQAH
jgi:hypothetical protein